MYNQNSIYSSNPSVNLGTWLVSLTSVWRYQVLEPAEGVDEWLSIYHVWRDSTPPRLSNFLQLPTLKNLCHIGARGCPPDLLPAEPLKTYEP